MTRLFLELSNLEYHDSFFEAILHSSIYRKIHFVTIRTTVKARKRLDKSFGQEFSTAACIAGLARCGDVGWAPREKRMHNTQNNGGLDRVMNSNYYERMAETGVRLNKNPFSDFRWIQSLVSACTFEIRAPSSWGHDRGLGQDC